MSMNFSLEYYIEFVLILLPSKLNDFSSSSSNTTNYFLKIFFGLKQKHLFLTALEAVKSKIMAGAITHLVRAPFLVHR